MPKYLLHVEFEFWLEDAGSREVMILNRLLGQAHFPTRMSGATSQYERPTSISIWVGANALAIHNLDYIEGYLLETLRAAGYVVMWEE